MFWMFQVVLTNHICLMFSPNVQQGSRPAPAAGDADPVAGHICGIANPLWTDQTKMTRRHDQKDEPKKGEHFYNTYESIWTVNSS